MALHHQVERALAAKDKRSVMKSQALRDRAAACQALLDQGLLPEQLSALSKHGLALGSPKDPRSLASLVRHLSAYLEAVNEQGYLEPAEALWRAAAAEQSGQRGFWVERHLEDGPLDAGLNDLKPARLRALCSLPGLGSVRFRFATRRGAGCAGLFSDREPHLVRQLLPALEALAVDRALDHLELEAPEGWGENPWGAALDGLFEGPLGLDEETRSLLQRAQLPTEAALWRGAIEQVSAWTDAGIAPSDITLIHPDPARIGPLLAPWLAAEGIPLRGYPGRPLKDAAPWGLLLNLLEGLRDLDPPVLAAGLATGISTPLGRGLRAFAARLDRMDQIGEGVLQQAVESLPSADQRWVQERWNFLWTMRGKQQSLTQWLGDLEALILRLELCEDTSAAYPVLGLLGEPWSRDAASLTLAEFLEDFRDSLEVMRTPTVHLQSAGVQLLGFGALESNWMGSRTTLLMDLGEGVWPAAPAALPELDVARQIALNRALRAQHAAGEGAIDFPARLQTFILPQAEEGEVLPKAFHRDAYGFNRVLALTGERLVALSAQRDAEGQKRSQGPFWQALEGAGTWVPDPQRAASRLRWRWEAAEPDAFTRERQAALATGNPAATPTLDLMPGLWDRGRSMESPLAPTLLEGLARCPFRVFAQKHLKLDAWEEGDAHILNLGTLAHRLMETMLAGSQGAGHWPKVFLEQLGTDTPTTAELLACLQRQWRAHGEPWFGELESLNTVERERLRLAVGELLPGLAEIIADDLAQESPTKEEMEFLEMTEGPAWRRELVGLERKLEPRSLVLPDGTAVWVHGTVDRLERWVSGDRRFLRIIDYKTSRYGSLKAYREEGGLVGAHLQLPLYQVLLEQEFQSPVTALLVSLKEPWKPQPMMLKREDQARLLANISALLQRAEAGDFPATPGDHCSTCSLAALCGRPVDIDVPEEAEA